jgi:hypothetical protein
MLDTSTHTQEKVAVVEMARREKTQLSCEPGASRHDAKLNSSFMMAKARRSAGKQRVIFWFNVSCSPSTNELR